MDYESLQLDAKVWTFHHPTRGLLTIMRLAKGTDRTIRFVLRLVKPLTMAANRYGRPGRVIPIQPLEAEPFKVYVNNADENAYNKTKTPPSSIWYDDIGLDDMRGNRIISAIHYAICDTGMDLGVKAFLVINTEVERLYKFCDATGMDDAFRGSSFVGPCDEVAQACMQEANKEHWTYTGGW